MCNIETQNDKRDQQVFETNMIYLLPIHQQLKNRQMRAGNTFLRPIQFCWFYLLGWGILCSVIIRHEEFKC